VHCSLKEEIIINFNTINSLVSSLNPKVDLFVIAWACAKFFHSWQTGKGWKLYSSADMSI